MFYAPCASRRRGHIILSAARPQFAQRPLSAFTKRWKLRFIYKNRLIVLECRTPCPSAPQFKADDFY